MSTTTDQLASLSIESEYLFMAPTEDVVKYRAAELQDILSSFDVDVLPTEFQAHIFDNITSERSPPLRRQQADWTISGDLSGTLLQWGSYYEEGWNFLNQIQTPVSRAIAFSEKLKRRFNGCLEEYDALESTSSAREIKDDVYRIAENLDNLSTALYNDRQVRVLGEIETLVVVLRALESICKRTETVIPVGAAGSTRRVGRRPAPLGDPSLSLFAVVIQQPSSGSTSQPFLLKALELFSSAALKECFDLLITVNGLLNRHDAGEEYIERFEALQQKANDESQIPLTAPGGSGTLGGGDGRSRGLEADPRPGSKRPQQPLSNTTPKRGKRGGA